MAKANAHKEALIHRVLEQINALPRKKKREGVYVLNVTKRANGTASNIRTGFLTRGDLRKPTSKGGFTNGELRMHSSHPIFEHSRSRILPIVIPIREISDIEVRP